MRKTISQHHDTLVKLVDSGLSAKSIAKVLKFDRLSITRYIRVNGISYKARKPGPSPDSVIGDKNPNWRGKINPVNQALTNR